jgi:hypothetical protein
MVTPVAPTTEALSCGALVNVDVALERYTVFVPGHSEFGDAIPASTAGAGAAKAAVPPVKIKAAAIRR